MATGDVLSIGLSGTQTTQREMATVSHNIANANNEDYSRQRVIKTTREPQQFGFGAIGSGVQVSSIRRVHNEFLTNTVRDNTSLANGFKIGLQLTKQVDDLLSDPKAGVAIVMQDFFDAVTGVANEPTSNTARQVMLSQAKTLTTRFHDLDNRLQDLRLAANKQTSNIITDINFLAESLAKLNRNITVSQQTTGQPANDLLDKRDAALKSLSEKINVVTKEQDDGALNVFVGNGQTLVLGQTASLLKLEVDEFDASKRNVVFEGAGSKGDITKFITGGELGGILNFQQDIINGSQNELGRISLALATTFNEQHESGLDLKSNFGKKFFSGLNDTMPEVISGVSNRGDYSISAKITDVSKVTASDYRLEYTGKEYLMIRLNDNVTVKTFSNLPQEIETDGFSLKLDSGSSIEVGDSYLIRPTHLAGKNIEVLIDDTTEIAAASAVRANSSISNVGDGVLELEYTDIRNIPIRDESGDSDVDNLDGHDESFSGNDDGSIKITQAGEPASSKIAFSLDDAGLNANSNMGTTKITIKILANNQLQIMDDSIDIGTGVSNSKALSAPINFDANETLMLKPTLNGKQLAVTAKLSGNLIAGDTFTIEFNEDAVGDNTNILALAKLHRANNLIEGRANYNQAYGELVSRVGSRTHELDVNYEAQQVLLNQAIQAKETVSGVNMDEEAAKLLRLQTQFKANAQVLSVGNDVFQHLMNLMSR